MILLLALLLVQPDPSAPRVDEGDRWETASLVTTFRGEKTEERRLIFWRRDAFGESQPAGCIPWETIISWHDEGDGFSFFWHDESDKCYRQLKVREWFNVGINMATSEFQWPMCRHPEFFGFLPNPERRE